EAEFADAVAQLAAEVVGADARNDHRGVAELVAVEREVERRPAGHLAAVRVHVPEDFADPDDGVHGRYLSADSADGRRLKTEDGESEINSNSLPVFKSVSICGICG